MDSRQWSEFLTQSGIQGDRTTRSFAPIWTGFSVSPTGNLSYHDFGDIVVIWNGTGSLLAGTSNANTMTITNLPASIRPDIDSIAPTFVIDSGSAFAGQVSVLANGTVGFTMLTVSGALIQAGVGGLFTAAGTKGLPTGWLIVYSKARSP